MDHWALYLFGCGSSDVWHSFRIIVNGSSTTLGLFFPLFNSVIFCFGRPALLVQGHLSPSVIFVGIKMHVILYILGMNKIFIQKMVQAHKPIYNTSPITKKQNK